MSCVPLMTRALLFFEFQTSASGRASVLDIVVTRPLVPHGNGGRGGPAAPRRLDLCRMWGAPPGPAARPATPLYRVYRPIEAGRDTTPGTGVGGKGGGGGGAAKEVPRGDGSAAAGIWFPLAYMHCS